MRERIFPLLCLTVYLFLIFYYRTKDGEALSSSTNVTVAADGCVQTCTISDVTKADEGCYTCTATNANGTATTAGTLTVESKL